MSLDEINKVLTDANMIVSGYAFTKKGDSNVHVSQLRSPYHALVMAEDGEVLETTMDDVELSIIQDCWTKVYSTTERYV